MFLPDSNEIKWGSNEEKEPVISDVFSQNVQPKVRDCKENTNVSCESKWFQISRLVL